MWDPSQQGLDRCILLDRQILYHRATWKVPALYFYLSFRQMKWKPHVVYFSWDETVTRRDSGYWFCVLSHGQSQAGFAKACAFFSSCVLFSRFPYIPQSQDLAAQGKWMFEWGLSTAPFIIWASLGAQWERILLPMQETWVQSLGWEDPLVKEMATHSSILDWKIPWTEEPVRLQSMGS